METEETSGLEEVVKIEVRKNFGEGGEVFLPKTLIK